MTGIIILAAGESSRLGSPKQNLMYQGQTLLQRAIQTALTCVCEKIIVVLGANEGVIRPNISDKVIHITYNADWQEGMASSIRLGVSEVLKLEPTVSSIIIMLCDQPFVDPFLISQLTEKRDESDCGIISCSYRGTFGVPALFDKKYFPELLQLTGRDGAKKVIEAHQDDVVILPFPLGAIDIDTIDDYEQLHQQG